MTRAHDSVIETAEHIEQTAAGWVTRIDLRGTPDEWARLDTWLAANPRHRAAFLRLSVAWRRADQLRGLAELRGEVDEDLLDPARWTHSAQDTASSSEPLAVPASSQGPGPLDSHRSPSHQLHLHELRAAGARPRARRRVYRLSARASRIAASFVALAVLVAAGAGGWLALNRNDTETYATAVGEFRRIPLKDGSVLTLNTDSTATVIFSASRRKVELARGEALFKVAHDTARPFDVQAGSALVRAVGTEFSVRLRNDSAADILVSEGRIAINPPSSLTFAAGTLARVRSGRIDASTLPSSDITRRLEWTSPAQRLSFQDATVAEVVAELNRYNTRQIVLAPDLAQQHIGGVFQARDLDGLTAALEHMFPVHTRHLSRASGVEIISVENGAP
jgi:transmembrane sensor